MSVTCAKLKKENDELRRRVAAVEEILWRLEGAAVPKRETEKPRCKDCGADPCDCEKLIWGYFYRNAHGAERFAGWNTRPDAVKELARTLSPDRRARLERGPVQRESDPKPTDWSF